MKINRLLFLIISLLLWAVPCYAVTTDVNCSSAANVNTAVGLATSGDTLRCTASGSWTESATLVAAKYLTLDLNGYTITLRESTLGSLIVYQHATGTNRVTNGNIVRGTFYVDTDRYTGSTVVYDLDEAQGLIRIDHINFSGTYVLVEVKGHYALIDNCTFTSGGAAEMIHITGPGTSGWSVDVTPGSQYATYIEDCTAVNTSTTINNLFQTYYGARVVSRYNTRGVASVGSVQIETHGTAGSVGARWYEMYKNTGLLSCIRAGSGVIFSNTVGTIMVEEDSGWPELYQVGRGKCQSPPCTLGSQQDSVPAYHWDSSTLSLNTVGCAAPAADMVQLNRDVFVPTSGTSLPGTCTTGQGYWKTDEGGDWDTTHGGANDGKLYKCTATDTWTAYYTPYTYPHPARNEETTGSIVWGHTTGVAEPDVRTFASGWTGTGTISSSGDSEKILLASGQYMNSPIISTGVKAVRINKNKYRAGTASVLKYRTCAVVDCSDVPAFTTYSDMFNSLGYVQIRVEAP